MIVYITLFLAIFFLGIVKNWNKNDRSKIIFLVISFTLLTIVAATRSSNVGVDLQMQYAGAYEQIAKMSWKDAVEYRDLFTRYEVGYAAYNKLLSYISDDVQFFIAITAILSFFSVAFFFYKNSKDVVLSTLCFLSFNVMFFYYSGLRQVLAITILLPALELLKSRRYVWFALCIWLASYFHTSIWFCLSLVLLNEVKFGKKGFFISLGALLIVPLGANHLASVGMGIFLNYADTYMSAGGKHYLSGHFNITALFRCFVVAVTVFYVFLMLKKGNSSLTQRDVVELRKKEFSNSFLLYTSLFALITHITILNVAILSRFRYYFFFLLMIALPKAVTAWKNQSNRTIAKNAVYAFQLVYFIFSCIILTKMWGVNSFYFFWE